MKMRMGAPLLFALIALLGATQAATASHCGAARFSIFRNNSCDAQNCYSSCQQQNRVTYKLVYDTVEEKRWHTSYKTETVTVNKQVTRVCYKDECKTMYKQCQVTKCREEMQECSRPVTRTLFKDVQCTVCKPVVETCVKEVECVVRRCVPKVCEKNCHYTVCRPVYEQHCHTKNCHVTKQICEQRVKECCRNVCREVCETRYREHCGQVTKCIEECRVKQICVPTCRTVTETAYRNCVKRICEPCTTMKTVTRRVVECVDVPSDPCRVGGLGGIGPFRGLFGGIGRGACSTGACTDGTACANGACAGTTSNACADPCFDPCACKTFHLFNRGGSGLGLGHGRILGKAGDPCADNCGPTRSACAPIPTTRKVWRVKCITEQVPCTTMVTRTVTEKVPYTVCRKITTNETRNVSYTVRRIARGAYVDAAGAGHECDGPGRSFREGAVARKTVPYTVRKMVQTVEKIQVPYTVSRIATGAYVDPQGGTHGTGGPGRTFQEGAKFQVVTTYTTKKMVTEQHVKKVQYTVNEIVCEKQIKRVPYQVCRMVPHTITKKVPYQVCEVQKIMVPRKVSYTECIQVPYTVRTKVPYTVVETIPCTETRRVKVCVPETVCIKKARMVPVMVDPGQGPACHDPAACGPNGCGKDCCDSKCSILNRTRQRWFASLFSTGCCEETCKTGFVGHGTRIGGGLLHGNTACSTDCNTTCRDFCREGLLQRLFRNRFACEPTCDTGCSTGACGPVAPMTPGAPAPDANALPKALPKN